ncbi:MAG: hypothetical protein LBS84_02860 [Clostridiales bacterium]|jgi:hypothetical protein|nr:hypothetical protein [Clostridiales bacterium]
MYTTMEEILTYQTEFYSAYFDPDNVILESSAEYRFINYLCRKQVDKAMALFEENQQFGGVRSAVDAPMGRFEGLNEIRDFAENWLNYAEAEDAWPSPVIQTRAGGRSCTEFMINYKLRDYDKVLSVPMFVIGDLRAGGKLDELRIYFFFKWLPNIGPYRHRIFKPSFNKPIETPLLTGVMREYIDCLSHLDPDEEMRRMKNMFSEDVVYGGSRPSVFSKVIRGKEEVIEKYFTFIQPKALEERGYVRFEAITDDGVTCVCEWVGTYPSNDLTKGLQQSGCASYTRDKKTGLLKGIRIIDNARFQDTIDWSTVKFRY